MGENPGSGLKMQENLDGGRAHGLFFILTQCAERGKGKKKQGKIRRPKHT